jgi:hypothetical protein
MKGEGCYRVIGTLPKAYSNREKINFPDIENVVLDTIGFEMTFKTVNWFSISNLHHRCVDHFSQGRVFLAGDSAHIHSPAGGQGMNTGLQDAYNLAWKLAFVLQGKSSAKLLNTYNEERLPFAKWLLKFTDRAFNIMTSENWFIKFFRTYVLLNLIGRTLGNSKIKQLAFKTVSQIGWSYKGKSLSGSNTKQKLRFKSGDRLPYLEDVSSKKFYELFRSPGFHLLHIGNELSEVDKLQIQNSLNIPVEVVESELSKSWKILGVMGELFILVRPDNYIGYIQDKFDEVELNKHYQGILSSSN